MTWVLSLLLCLASGFYLPGVAPRDYQDGEAVDLKTNKLDSVKTQLPYDYYDLPFCRPSRIEEVAENLGEVMTGDRIENSPYEISLKLIESCKILCRRKYNQEQLRLFASRIDQEYRVNWLVDNLPAATTFYQQNEQGEYVEHYEKGFPLGFVGNDLMTIPDVVPGVRYIHNHVRLVLFYHQEEHQQFSGFRIVGFEVEPYSVKHVIDGAFKEERTKLKTCTALNKVTGNSPAQPVSGLTEEEILWTYDVQWEESDVKWASRWDLYLRMTDSQIHWFSIMNSTMIVMFLSCMVAMIMMRALRQDLNRYNNIEEVSVDDLNGDRVEFVSEERGWKVIHSDVFRPPSYGAMLATLVGTGVQVLAMSCLTLFFAMLGFLSPANRGSLMTALLLLFVSMGMFAGYHSMRTRMLMKLGDSWKYNAMCTALFYPGIIFTVFFILNLFVWGERSSGAVPFPTLLALLVIWFGISVPLVCLGSYLASNKPAFKPPVKVKEIPRSPNENRPWYAHPTLSIAVGGILPFGACFIEIFFIMTSLWMHQYYYMFGCLFIVFIILLVTCAEITIVICYFQLCSEDYHWWWRSFLAPGSSAIYLFLYSIVYFFTKLEIIKWVSALLFFGYMFLVSLTFFIITGTIGFLSCFWFVNKIYSALKID